MAVFSKLAVLAAITEADGLSFLGKRTPNNAKRVPHLTKFYKNIDVPNKKMKISLKGLTKRSRKAGSFLQKKQFPAGAGGMDAGGMDAAGMDAAGMPRGTKGPAGAGDDPAMAATDPTMAAGDKAYDQATPAGAESDSTMAATDPNMAAGDKAYDQATAAGAEYDPTTMAAGDKTYDPPMAAGSEYGSAMPAGSEYDSAMMPAGESHEEPHFDHDPDLQEKIEHGCVDKCAGYDPDPMHKDFCQFEMCPFIAQCMVPLVEMGVDGDQAGHECGMKFEEQHHKETDWGEVHHQIEQGCSEECSNDMPGDKGHEEFCHKEVCPFIANCMIHKMADMHLEGEPAGQMCTEEFQHEMEMRHEQKGKEHHGHEALPEDPEQWKDGCRHECPNHAHAHDFPEWWCSDMCEHMVSCVYDGNTMEMCGAEAFHHVAESSKDAFVDSCEHDWNEGCPFHAQTHGFPHELCAPICGNMAHCRFDRRGSEEECENEAKHFVMTHMGPMEPEKMREMEENKPAAADVAHTEGKQDFMGEEHINQEDMYHHEEKMYHPEEMYHPEDMHYKDEYHHEKGEYHDPNGEHHYDDGSHYDDKSWEDGSHYDDKSYDDKSFEDKSYDDKSYDDKSFEDKSYDDKSSEDASNYAATDMNDIGSAAGAAGDFYEGSEDFAKEAAMDGGAKGAGFAAERAEKRVLLLNKGKKVARNAKRSAKKLRTRRLSRKAKTSFIQVSSMPDEESKEEEEHHDGQPHHEDQDDEYDPEMPEGEMEEMPEGEMEEMPEEDKDEEFEDEEPMDDIPEGTEGKLSPKKKRSFLAKSKKVSLAGPFLVKLMTKYTGKVKHLGSY